MCVLIVYWYSKPIPWPCAVEGAGEDGGWYLNREKKTPPNGSQERSLANEGRW